MSKVIWITGAGSGIGKALATEYANNGNTLILSGRQREKLEDTASSLKNKTARLHILEMDICKEPELIAKTEEVIKLFGRIDILINNAGMSQRAEVKDIQNSVGRQLMELNFFGSIHLSKAVLPYMLRANSGHLVVISSATGKFGFPLRSYYAASKHALHGFFESLSLELKSTNIRILMVCPGRIKTDISRNALKADGSPHAKMDEGQEKGIPASVCAARIKKAVEKNKAEIYIGGNEVLMIYFKRYLPGLFRFIAKRVKAR